MSLWESQRPPHLRWSFRVRTLLSLRATSGRCVRCAAVLMRCSRAKRSSLSRPVMFGHLCENPAAGRFHTAPTRRDAHLARGDQTRISRSFSFPNCHFCCLCDQQTCTSTSASIPFDHQCAFLQTPLKKIKFELTFSKFQSL